MRKALKAKARLIPPASDNNPFPTV
jgi:hypothetical protein